MSFLEVCVGGVDAPPPVVQVRGQSARPYTDPLTPRRPQRLWTPRLTLSPDLAGGRGQRGSLTCL